MVYLVLGNHTTLSGVWEQVEITLRTFSKMGISISLSSRIVPSKVNIFIEDFSSSLVKEIEYIKNKYPKTICILYVTEYLTLTKNGNVNLNCFSKRERIVRAFFKMEYISLGDTYYLFQGGSQNSKLKSKLRSVFSKFLAYLAKLSGTSYGNEMMMARREACLDKLRDTFSLCISTTEAVLSGYNDYCNCPLEYLPVMIDMNRVKKNRLKRSGFKAIFFSGRLTPYRHKVCISIGEELLNSYPLEGGPAWDDFQQLKDTKYKLLQLENEKEAFQEGDAIRFSNEIKAMEFRSFQIITNIYNYLAKDKVAAYELYIPQSSSWLYSSPNRTILSIESGLIPIDFGSFSDHAVNEVALTAINNNDLSEILTQNLEVNYENLDEKISEYNNLQVLKCHKVKQAILSLLK